MIEGMFDNGAMPVLERLVQFTEARQKVLADNVANLSTPYFKPRDLDVGQFQKVLARAIDQRRARAGDPVGPLPLEDTDQITFKPDGIQTTAQPANQNILFHDQNNRDLERTMQHVAENALTHNVAIELLRSEYSLLRTAIRERL